MNSLSAALGWLGVALILAPFAIFCVFVAVAIDPNAAIIVSCVLIFVLGRKLVEKRKDSAQ